jgi:hypothetical protein
MSLLHPVCFLSVKEKPGINNIEGCVGPRKRPGSWAKEKIVLFFPGFKHHVVQHYSDYAIPSPGTTNKEV